MTGYGSADWKRTHEEAVKTALVVSEMLKNGATCVGKTVLSELGFGYCISLDARLLLCSFD